MAESANFEVNTFNKTYSVLIRKCIEMPNAPYLNVSSNNLNLIKMKKNLIILTLVLVSFISRGQHPTTLYENNFTSAESDSVFVNPFNFFILNSGIDSSFNNSSYLEQNDIDNTFEVNLNSNWAQYDSVKISLNLYWYSANQYAFDIRDNQWFELFKEHELNFGSLTSESVYEIDITDWLDNPKLIFTYNIGYVNGTWEQVGFFLFDDLKITGYSNILSVNSPHSTINNKMILYYVDMTGKKVTLENTHKNTMLISVYNDGTKERFIKK